MVGRYYLVATSGAPVFLGLTPRIPTFANYYFIVIGGDVKDRARMSNEKPSI
jgi:hypothetical protein